MQKSPNVCFSSVFLFVTFLSFVSGHFLIILHLDRLSLLSCLNWEELSLYSKIRNNRTDDKKCAQGYIFMCFLFCTIS